MNKIYIVIILIIIFFSSCRSDSDPGYEFMPNMYRSPSIETYSQHNIQGYTGDPVKGTIPRGYVSTFRDSNGIKYTGTDEDYKRAGKESTYPDTIYTVNLSGGIESHLFLKDEKTLNEGKILYDMMCAHCHGETGLGDGPVTKTSNPNYSADVNAIPKYNDDKSIRARAEVPMSQLKEGHIFHAITYGLGAMGPHASQITEEERWKIVYYIQKELQNYGKE